jgi:4-amino-4-deoxy-L-arabinose transferase-like glycosyltransferase
MPELVEPRTKSGKTVPAVAGVVYRAGSVLLFVVAAIAVVRLVSLAAYPLGDTTEARYAEVARQMVATGDWITPQLDHGVPFWAKPPLSSWAQAATLRVFGVNEFGARVSSTLFAALICIAIGSLLRRQARKQPAMTAGVETAWLAVAALATMPLFYLMAGAVMTDMALVCLMTLAMTSFWRCMSEVGGSRWHSGVFFLSAGATLLAKGLVGPVLIGVALCLFVVLSPDRKTLLLQALARFRWIEGLALATAIAIPWYVIAEIRTPGFLDYFIFGEHFARFVDQDWQGDRFGTAHPQPRGKIWVFFLLASLVWIPYLLLLLGQRWRQGTVSIPGDGGLSRYLIAWVLAPLLFFSGAGNTIESYTLPALPPLAALLAYWTPRGSRWLWRTAAAIAVSGAMLLSAASLFWLPQPKIAERRSAKPVVLAAERVAARQPIRLYGIRDLPDSAKFYTDGTAQAVSFEQALEILAQPGEVFFMIREVDMIASSNRAAWLEFFLQLDRVGLFGKYVLYRRPDVFIGKP